MISSLETGAIFKIIDEASPALIKISDALKEMQGLVDRTKESFTALAKSGFAGLTERINTLAGSLGKVEESSGAIAGNLDRAMLSAAGSITSVGDSIGGLTARIAALNEQLAATTTTSARAAESAAASSFLGGPRGSGSPLPTEGSGGGAPSGVRSRSGGGHGGGSGIALREGGHLGPLALGGPMGLAAMGGAAALGWGILDQNEMNHSAAMGVYGSNDKFEQDHPQEAIESIRTMSLDLATKSGINPLKIATGVRKMTHLLSGSGGMNYEQMMDLEKEVLSYAAGETLTKGTPIESNAESFVEMAHQAGIYDKKGIETMLSAVQAGGVMTPAGLPQVTGALSYSLQQLSAKHLIDARTDIADVIAMQRMGILRTKSGTWVRDFYEHLLPDLKKDKDGNPSQHDEALQRMGLSDKKGKLLWHAYNKDGTEDYTQEQANIGNILSGYATKELAQGDHGKEVLNQDLHAGFGAQGGSFAAILADPKYAQQVKNVADVLNNFKGGDKTIDWFAKNDPSVEFNKTWVDFQKAMMDLAQTLNGPIKVALMSVDASLKTLDAGILALAKIFSHAPGTDGKTYIPDGLGGGMWTPQSWDGSTAGLLHKISGGDLGGRGGSGITAAIAIDKAVIAINQGALTGGGAGGGGFMTAAYETGGSGGSGSAAGGYHSGGGYHVTGGGGGGNIGASSAELDAMAASGTFPDSAAGRAAFIRANAMKMGVDPNYALGVAKSGGLFAAGPLHQNAEGYNVFGDFQLNYARGVGVAARNAGIEPSDWQRSDLFALQWMKDHGTNDWAASGHHGPVPLYHALSPLSRGSGYHLPNVYSSSGQSSEYPAPGEHVFGDDYSGSDNSHRSPSMHAAWLNIAETADAGVPVHNHIDLKINEKTIATAVQRHIVNANRQVYGPGKPDFHGHLQPVDSGYQWDR